MMRTRFLNFGLVLSLGAFAAAEEPKPVATPDPSVPLRAKLLDFGGALANEGFRLRDGFWSGRLEPDKPRRLAVNLFAGNQYWFCAALGAPGSQPVLALYSPEGEEVEVAVYDGEGWAAGGVTAGVTGRYVLELKAPRGTASQFCLIYLFK